MKPDYNAALDFLKDIQPEGPWNLIAIWPERSETPVDGAASLVGRTFHPGDEIIAWLKQFPRRNFYYTLNPIMRDIDTKPSRSDIKSLAWLHVDLDPRAREDVAEEQARILKLCDAMKPVPSRVVYSGGGYQALWRISDPLPIDGQEDAYQEAKLYNLQLEIQYDADNCHNVDRIMRLPGTINQPDKRKREKGRTPQLAKVVRRNDVSYSLADFTKAPQVQSADTGLSGHTVQVSGNVQRLANLEDLSVHNQCKRVIAKGMDPDEPAKWSSRSEPLWWVVCEMVREDVDDDTIYSIITDPDWEISGHVLDQSRPHDYAIRQIERAHDEAGPGGDPILCELNDNYAVVRIGGKVVILHEEETPIGDGDVRPAVHYMTFADFTNYYGNRFIKREGKDGGMIKTPVGKWWIAHERRRTYTGVCFVPGEEIVGYYNLWKGFGYEARPGDCEPFLEHIRDNICQGSTEWYEYLVGWMAHAVQHPNRPGEVAVVFRGKPGTGKGFFFNHFGKLFGRHFLPVRDSNHVFGKFTMHMQECVFLFLDECVWAGNKKQEGMLKSLITEDTVLTEGKGTNAQISRNFLHLGVASNESWVVPVGDFDRRFFVLDVGDDHRKDRAYFGGIIKNLESGGYEALLHYLLSYDISGFDVTDVPSTEAHKEQQEFSMDSVQEWWFTKLREGSVYPGEDWPANVWAQELQQDLTEHLMRWGGRASNPSILGRFLTKVLPLGYTRKQSSKPSSVRQPNGEMKIVHRPYFYPMPSLDETRAHWEQTFGASSWPEAVELVDLGEHDTGDF